MKDLSEKITRLLKLMKTARKYTRLKINHLVTINKEVRSEDRQKVKKASERVKSNPVKLMNTKKHRQCWTCGGWGHASKKCPTGEEQ